MVLSPASHPVFDKRCIEGWQKQYPEEKGGEGAVWLWGSGRTQLWNVQSATIVCLPCCSGGARFYWIVLVFLGAGGGNDIQWCFSQVKGAVDDDVAEGKSDIFYCFLTF